MSFYTLSIVQMCLIAFICQVNVLSHVIGANVELMHVGDISKQKCSEMYSTLTSASGRERASLSSIVDAEPGEFPHMAILGYEDKDNKTNWLCGGILISEKFMLTAAQCLYAREYGPVKYVRVGDIGLEPTTHQAGSQAIAVAKATAHSGYKPPSAYNDIALIELAKNVEINNFVRPACIYTEATMPNGKWGGISWGLKDRRTNRLRKVNVEPISLDVCQASFSTTSRKLRKGIDFDKQICAMDSCEGDSGTPLQIRNSEFTQGYKVFGVTAFGKSCDGLNNPPTVYTRVSHYVEWIESIVWPQ